MAQHTYLVAGTTRQAIQDQIDAAHRDGGGTVYVPPGTYALDKALRVKSNVRLVGAGSATTLTMHANADDRFNVNFIEFEKDSQGKAHDIEIRALRIQGPGTSANIHEQTAKEPQRGCGIYSDGMALARIVVAECHIENVGGCGMRFDADGQRRIEDVRIEHCRLRQNRIPLETGDDEAMRKAGSYKDISFVGAAFENIRIEGNVCAFTPSAGNHYGNDSGIAFVHQGAGGFVRSVHVVNNVCSGHRRHGIITSYGLENDGVFAAGNTCDGNGWVGIYVNPGKFKTERLVITGNRCAHNGTFGSLKGRDSSIRGGIVLNYGSYAVVSDNICLKNGHVSPQLAELGVRPGTDSERTAGIRVRGKNNIVTGNLVAENVSDGIMTWPGDVTHISITNNRSFDNGGHGIAVMGASGDTKRAREMVVVGNLCTGNAGSGVLTFEADGVLLSMNYNEGNKQGKFAIKKSKNVVQPDQLKDSLVPGGN